jgi:hypothetical protein
LAETADFVNLDPRLFASVEEAGRFPLQVFQLETAK